MTGLLKDLTDPQREATVHTDGPLLILAGPGSGKTRVVTRRAAYLASTVAEPRDILAITFTNKAAREMYERVAALGFGEGMTVCTFHALCARLLRIHHDRANVPRDFTIFDREDRRKVLKKAIAECNLSTDNWSPARVEQDISNAKNDMLTAADFAETENDWRHGTIARIYAAYETALTEMGGLDFDDLLMRVAILLKHDSELRRRLEDRYRYVLIDEYQDTNAAQYAIARLLTEQRKNLCATGDPDQSIYGWRGANIENILTFERDYPGAKVVRLEQNFRSTKLILDAADRLISANTLRKEKTLWTEGADGSPVHVVESESGNEEASAIAREIGRQLRHGVAPSEIAVFYRINSLSRGIEEALLHQGIAYQVARGVEFYNRKEIKDVLAYLRVLVNPADEVSLLRIINTPTRGIGATTVRRLTERAQESGRSIYETLQGEDLAALGRSAAKVRQFGELLRELAPAPTLPARQALEMVMSRSGLRALYHDPTGVDDAPAANLDELLNAAALFQQEHADATVRDWLEYTALLSDVDGVRENGGTVTLMTLHAAKGLEFETVFIMGLEDGMLPFKRRDEEPADEEEERRLLFVGMTRAKRHLTLSRARYRMLRGETSRTVRSPFLDELPRDQLHWDAPEPKSVRHRSDSARGRLPDDIEQWGIGTLVEHPEFGLGQVLAMHRGFKRSHVDVLFKSGARKSWVLEFAQLKRVDFDEIE